jgi:putative ABC transport system ATP-binding protein
MHSVTGAKLLLVDEPTASLDRTRGRDVVELLARQSREHGVATVMVTHDHDVLSFCGRIVKWWTAA